MILNLHYLTKSKKKEEQLINFRVIGLLSDEDIQQFQSKKNMTWDEWINSSYNTYAISYDYNYEEGFYYENGEYCVTVLIEPRDFNRSATIPDHCSLAELRDSNGNSVMGSDIIINNEQYYLEIMY